MQPQSLTNSNLRSLSREYFLSAGDVNAEGEMSLPLLTAKIIDISTAHANMLGVGNPAMEDIGCGWVLSRLTIEMERYPRVNEAFTLTTWVEVWNRHFSMRDYRIEDTDGNALGYARSVWMVMDTLSHENKGLSHLKLDPETLAPEIPCPIERQSKHKSLGAEFAKRKYRFRYCDIDFYRHVNTVRYVELLLNGYSVKEMDAKTVRRLELSFLHEGHFDSEVEIRQSDDGDTSSFTLYDVSGQREILYARIKTCDRR